jgi:hypothetical protein
MLDGLARLSGGRRFAFESPGSPLAGERFLLETAGSQLVRLGRQARFRSFLKSRQRKRSGLSERPYGGLIELQLNGVIVIVVVSVPADDARRWTVKGVHHPITRR